MIKLEKCNQVEVLCVMMPYNLAIGCFGGLCWLLDLNFYRRENPKFRVTEVDSGSACCYSDKVDTIVIPSIFLNAD
jgi:hypothetical protein